MVEVFLVDFGVKVEIRLMHFESELRPCQAPSTPTHPSQNS